MNPRKKLAADLLAAERFLQLSRDPSGIAAAKRWLEELERESMRLLRGQAAYRARTES
jgi:hypothetical protein